MSCVTPFHRYLSPLPSIVLTVRRWRGLCSQSAILEVNRLPTCERLKSSVLSALANNRVTHFILLMWWLLVNNGS